MNPFVYSTYRRGDIVIKSSVLDSNDEYMIVAHAFLQKLIREFARLSVKCCRPQINATNMPYYYTERRLDTVVLPAISRICDGVVLTELPVIREISGEAIGSGIGRADYWCIFREYTFVIEMKGAFMYYDGGTVREHSVKKRWGEMISQLRNIKDECRFRGEYTKGIIRLGLHFITSYANEKPDYDKIKQYRRCVTSTLNTFCREIAKSHRKADFIPSYAAAWLIHDSVINAEEEEITYPGIMLIAKVFRDIKHKNHI